MTFATVAGVMILATTASHAQTVDTAASPSLTPPPIVILARSDVAPTTSTSTNPTIAPQGTSTTSPAQSMPPFVLRVTVSVAPNPDVKPPVPSAPTALAAPYAPTVLAAPYAPAIPTLRMLPQDEDDVRLERHARTTTERYLVESAAGVGGLALAGLIGLTGGVVTWMMFPGGACSSFTIGAAVSGTVASLVAVPMAVTAAGASRGGFGGAGSALLGMLVGVGAGAVVAGFTGTELGVAALATLPVLGAVIGYEVHSSAVAGELRARTEQRARNVASTRWMPSVAPVFTGDRVTGAQMSLGAVTF